MDHKRKIILIVMMLLLCLSSSIGAALMMGGGTDASAVEKPVVAETDDPAVEKSVVVKKVPTKYVYEFIVKETSPYAKKFNIHITDIRANGKRVSGDKIKVHQEPGWAKCNSKEGGYECEGKKYGFNDPEPASPSYKDLTWSGWKDGQGKVGDKIFTMTFPSKISKFEMDYFRPKYVPGWTIKENGVKVLTTSKGPNKDKPNPATVKYVIP